MVQAATTSRMSELPEGEDEQSRSEGEPDAPFEYDDADMDEEDEAMDEDDEDYDDPSFGAAKRKKVKVGTKRKVPKERPEGNGVVKKKKCEQDLLGARLR